MLDEFYNFIAKKINSFFQTASSDDMLLKGESFCLKLDDEEMVVKVTEALKHLLENNNTIGEYVYQCGDGSLYKTFTIRATNDDIIIASQVNGMTNDFLCATLRNAANEEQKPLLMISSNLIDSAKSGSRDLSAGGMPFHAEVLMREIREMVENSTLLTETEKRILRFELDRRDEDVFSDKASIYEYGDLLAIMSSGRIERSNFPGFRLFSVNGKTDYQNYSSSQIDKEIRDNHLLFEKIDRGFRFGDIESVLAKDFEENYIIKIEKTQKEHQDDWSRFFTYAELVAAMEKKHRKTETPLRIDNDNISIYGDLPLHTLIPDVDYVIRNEGSQNAKKRTKNIFVFNSNHYTNIHVEIECNARITNNGIQSDDATLQRNGRSLIFEFNRSGISFHRISISDDTNGITYIFKLCLVDMPAQYMIDLVKRSALINIAKARNKSRIEMNGVSNNLIFNPNGLDVISEQLEDNATYSCAFGQRLLIYSTDEELDNSGSGIKIDIDFSGVTVPFSLFPDKAKSIEITGRRILRDKLANKKSFEYNDGAILSESQEYFAKANLLRELRIEKQFISDRILFGTCKYFYQTEFVEIEAVCDLVIPEGLKEAYYAFLAALHEKNTIPTLAFLGDVYDEALKYVKAFEKCFEGLEDGANLSIEQENALFLGSLSVGKSNDEIIYTPFHPLNIKYQLALLDETGMEFASDIVLDRLNSVNLLPYIQRNKRIYKVSDQLYSQEWKYYAPVENKKYRGSRRFVSKLVEEKITEFVSHFKYIFDDINNRVVKISLINMGDCSEVFTGLAQYYIHAVNKNADIEKMIKFEVHIYSKDMNGNVFNNIKEFGMLKNYLSDKRLTLEAGISMHSLESIIAKNLSCYFHKDNGKDYEYSHITFYEMESEITSEQATMSNIESGVSLGGILSGIPSSKYGYKYRTGFGSKYAEKTSLTEFAIKLNSIMQVETTGNPYYSGTSISTQIDELAESKMEQIYAKTNWVVFVDPKVDLDFFSEKEADSDLLIIHYSDQYTSSSGYDAITVTHKSYQYAQVILEYLVNKGVKASVSDVHGIINLFNAINGDWLLRLISSKKASKESTFSREKISIVAAIKFMLAFLKHPDIIWIPISLEEMLRVSGGAGLSKDEGVLSAKNLGFEKGPTSDDLLFVGLNSNGAIPQIYLYPVEVKTGNNDTGVIKKAFEQASSTANGLRNAFNPGGEIMQTILYKVNRNFLMQLLVTSCKKMKSYHVDDSQDWSIVLDQYREALLNDKFEFSDKMQEILGKGAVLSFRKTTVSRKASFMEDSINFLEMPESDEFGLILQSVEGIYDDIRINKSDDIFLFDECDLKNITGDLTKLTVRKLDENKDDHPEQSDDADDSGLEPRPERSVDGNETDTASENSETDSVEKTQEETKPIGMSILFGTNEQDNSDVFWRPNDTTQLFHTNTGIIGTMGTGKTQFTKSLIAQLYLEQKNNVDGQEIGILIFDYKGDYNESKQDFVQTTNAKIYKPYHLPFNPLALTKSRVFKPLLPTHTANAFKDTLSKVYNLGPKQQNTLLQCIMDAYASKGINPGDINSWDNEAPTFEQVYLRYINDEEIKKGDSLTAALDKLHMFQVFESDPKQTRSLFDLLKGVVVIDLSGYDPDIQSLIIAITLDLFYSQMQAAGSSKMEGNERQLTKLILVDEADNFMSEGFPALKKILKEGREFGVGTILSTQFLRHFGNGEDDYAAYILTWVVHNVSDLKGADVEFVFKTDPKGIETARLYNAIKSLQKHHSIVKIGNGKPVYLLDKAFWQLYNEIN